MNNTFIMLRERYMRDTRLSVRVTASFLEMFDGGNMEAD